MKPTEHLTITERPGTYITVMSDSRGPIIVVSDGPGARASRYTPEEAAKLGLAILEAAGVPMQGDFSRPVEGTEVHLSFIAQHLERYVVESEHIAAESRERAELEAEALGLYLACFPNHAVHSFDQLRGKTGDQWLAVARRARELAKEATK